MTLCDSTAFRRAGSRAWSIPTASTNNLHDWGWLYLAPYGWVPRTSTTGRFEQAPDIEWFYLGGFDAYRIAFNDDYGREFVPAKTHFRSETVDLQRGEAGGAAATCISTSGLRLKRKCCRRHLAATDVSIRTNHTHRGERGMSSSVRKLHKTTLAWHWAVCLSSR